MRKILSEKIKDILWILLLQILTVPLVVLSFRTIEPKRMAAVVAACIFIAVGFTMIQITRKWVEYRSHLCYWCIRVHVFVFSVPMLIGRLIFWEKDFNEIMYFNIPGPTFHRFSEKFYIILFACTLIDLLIEIIRERKKQKNNKL